MWKIYILTIYVLRRKTNFSISTKISSIYRILFHERDKETLFPSAEGKRKMSKFRYTHRNSFRSTFVHRRRPPCQQGSRTKIQLNEDRFEAFLFPTFDNLADSFILAGRQSESSVQCAVNGAGGYEARRVIEGEGRGIERVEWGRSEKCSDSGRFMQRLKNFRIPIPSFFVLELRRLRGTALSN